MMLTLSSNNEFWSPVIASSAMLFRSLQSEAKLQPIYHMNNIACINMELLLNQVEFQVDGRLTLMQPPALTHHYCLSFENLIYQVNGLFVVF
ncbi:hypothetical protein ACJIZ3_014499 [Penstemon smallii]|uniref:Uncharacterized protein n=1 Tax=Penstemon smallii TaxID=265156 RepID=A0ABD3RN00_9LAMI